MNLASAILGDRDAFKQVDMAALWRLIDTFSPAEVEVMRATWDETGQRTEETMSSIEARLRRPGEFTPTTYRERVLRRLRFPSKRKLYDLTMRDSAAEESPRTKADGPITVEGRYHIIFARKVDFHDAVNDLTRQANDFLLASRGSEESWVSSGGVGVFQDDRGASVFVLTQAFIRCDDLFPKIDDKVVEFERELMSSVGQHAE